MKKMHTFNEFLNKNFINEAKPAGSPDWHDSDAPDANGRFRDLGIKDLAAWLIKTRKKDVKKISGSLTQQIVFNRKDDPDYAEKMEKVRKEVYRQLGREDLLKESELLENRNIEDFYTLLNESVDQNIIDEAVNEFLKKYKNGDQTIEQLEKELDEGLIGSIVGGLTGFALGQSVGKIVANALGVEKGLLYDIFTSRLVGAAIGFHLGKRI